MNRFLPRLRGWKKMSSSSRASSRARYRNLWQLISHLTFANTCFVRRKKWPKFRLANPTISLYFVKFWVFGSGTNLKSLDSTCQRTSSAGFSGVSWKKSTAKMTQKSTEYGSEFLIRIKKNTKNQKISKVHQTWMISIDPISPRVPSLNQKLGSDVFYHLSWNNWNNPSCVTVSDRLYP